MAIGILQISNLIQINERLKTLTDGKRLDRSSLSNSNRLGAKKTNFILYGMLLALGIIFVIDTSIVYHAVKTNQVSTETNRKYLIFFYIDSGIFFTLTTLLVSITALITCKVQRHQGIGSSYKDRFLHIFLISVFALGFLIFALYDITQFLVYDDTNYPYNNCIRLFDDYRLFLIILPFLDYLPI